MFVCHELHELHEFSLIFIFLFKKLIRENLCNSWRKTFIKSEQFCKPELGSKLSAQSF